MPLLATFGSNSIRGVRQQAGGGGGGSGIVVVRYII